LSTRPAARWRAAQNPSTFASTTTSIFSSMRAATVRIYSPSAGRNGALKPEGMAVRDLTVTRPACRPPWPTLRSKNAIESMIEICRDHATNVERWRDGPMTVHWCAAGLKRFSHLPALRAALQAHAQCSCRTALR